MRRGRPAGYYCAMFLQFYHLSKLLHFAWKFFALFQIIAIALFIWGAFIVVHADKYEIKKNLLESCLVAFSWHLDQPDFLELFQREIPLLVVCYFHLYKDVNSMLYLVCWFINNFGDCRSYYWNIVYNKKWKSK